MSEEPLLVDMDEVLVDFRSGACSVHGWNREEIDHQTITLNCWDMLKPTGVTMNQFWEPIHNLGEQFWSLLEPLPWFDQLVQVLNTTYGTHWYIVSSPSRCPTSYYGKAIWIEKYFGHEFMNYRFLPFCNKQLLAKLGTLIDDRPDNVAKFVQAGGDAILFPSVGNKLHHLRHNPVEYLKEQLL